MKENVEPDVKRRSDSFSGNVFKLVRIKLDNCSLPILTETFKKT